MEISIEKKIFLGFFFTIILVGAIGIISYLWLAEQRKIQNLENQRQAILLSTDKISALTHNIDNNTKGFIITENEKYIDSFNTLFYLIGVELDNLKLLTEQNKSQTITIDKLERIVYEKINKDNQLIEFRKYKSFDSSKADLIRENDVQGIYTASSLVAAIQSEENKIFLSKENKIILVDRIYRIAFPVLFIGVILTFVLIYFVVRNKLKSRKRIQIISEKNNSMLQGIMDNTTNAIFIKDLSGEYLFINKKFQQLFHHSIEQLKGLTDHHIFPKPIADSLRNADLDTLKAGKEIKLEEIFPQEDGNHIYLVSKFPIKDKDGKTFAIGGVGVDITERKKSELLAHENELQIQTIFNAAPNGVIVINEEGNIIKWNPQSEIIFGWKESEVIGKSIYSLIIPEKNRDKYIKGLKQFLKTGEGATLNHTMEIAALNKQNKEFDIALTVSYTILNDKYIFIAFVKDITERKRLERELLESKNFLDSIIENIPDMVFVKEANELRFVTLNKAGEELLGYPSEDVIGKNDFDFFPHEQADFFISKDREVLAKGTKLDIPEEPVDTKYGKRWLHTQKIPIMDEKGKRLYLLGISADITERRKLEIERNSAEKLLQENEQRMKLILENIGEGVMVIDADRKILLYNKMGQDLYGIKNETLLQLNWSNQYEIYYPDRTVYPAQELPIEKALKGIATDEVEIILQDQKTQESKRIKVTGRPIKDEKNNIIAAVATIRDITKYNELEQALKESETKYRKLIGFKRE